VVGGSSTDFAGADSPASNATYLLDFSVTPLVWRRENMATARVMPDAVLLPDGVPFLSSCSHLSNHTSADYADERYPKGPASLHPRKNVICLKER
jgi:hypothetical protein